MNGNETARIDALTNAVGKLQGVVETLTAQWSLQENHASAGRAIIHQKIDALTREVGNVSADVRSVTQEVAELKNDVDGKIVPAIDSYGLKAAHSDGRRDGIAWSSRLFYVLLAGVASVVGFAIHEAIVYFGHVPKLLGGTPGVH